VLLVGGVATTILAVVDPTRRIAAVPAVPLLVAFAIRQLRAERPLLPVAVLRSRAVIGANVVLALLGGSMLGFQFLITLYLQNILGYTPAQAGSAILPIPLGIGALSLLGYLALSRRVGTRALIVPGMLTVAMGMAWLVFTPTHGQYAGDLLPSMLLFAVGGGITIPAIMTTAMSETTADAAGASSGLLNTSQQIGSAIGLALLSSIAVATTSQLMARGRGPDVATVGGYHVAWACGAALLALATGIAAVTLRRSTTLEHASAEPDVHEQIMQ
jgi:hypothetical protein